MRHLLLLVMALPLHAGIPSTGTTIFGNGNIDTPNRIQLVIVGDGYLESQLPDFRTAADKLVENLFKHSPYKEYKHCFVVTRVDVTSNVSGTTEQFLFLADPTNYRPKDTPYKAVLRARQAPNTPGFDPANNPAVRLAANNLPGNFATWSGTRVMNAEHAFPALFDKAEEGINATLPGKRRDMIIVLVNSKEVINGWATFAGAKDPLYSYVGSDWDYGEDNDPAGQYGWDADQLWGTAEVLAHEIGHSLFDLKDEYQGNPGPATVGDFLASQVENGEVKSVNVSLKAEGKESWKRWKNAGLITGPIQGGATFDAGVWRAEDMCKMNVHQGSTWDGEGWADRNLGGVNGTFPFSPVCLERGVQSIYGRVSLIDKVVPADHVVKADDSARFQGHGGQNVIRVETLGSSDRKITGEWYLDGKKVADNDGLTRTETDKGPIFEYRIEPAKIPAGYHFVFFMTQDRSPLVEGRPADSEPIAILPPFFRFWLIHVEQPNIVVRLLRKLGWGDE